MTSPDGHGPGRRPSYVRRRRVTGAHDGSGSGPAAGDCPDLASGDYRAYGTTGAGARPPGMPPGVAEMNSRFYFRYSGWHECSLNVPAPGVAGGIAW